MMSEKHGVPGSQKEGEQTALALTLPGASSSSKGCLPGTSARAFSSSETLQCLEGKHPCSASGCLLGQQSLVPPPWAPGLSPHPGLAHLFVPFHFGGGCRKPECAGSSEAHIFLQACGPEPVGFSYPFWMWGARLCSFL